MIKPFLQFGSVRKQFVSVNLFSFVEVMKDVKEGALSS